VAGATGPTGPTGYIAGISSTDVITALGFTPENSANKGQANGYAPLDSSTKISSTYLPSYVDDVLEYANLAAFPATGETAKIYVDLATNKMYRWSGSAYVEISASPGSTDAVTEGTTNKYYTDTRARASLSATQNIAYNTATGVITSPDLSGYLTAASTTTLTNKRITQRVQTIAVAAGTTTQAWNSDSYDQGNLTLSNTSGVTIAADSGTPTDAQKIMFRLKDNGTARTVAWTTGSTNSFRVVGTTLPTTTVVGKLMYVGCVYNLTDSRWDVIAVGQEA
jgi:hypothetical protein